MIKQTACPVGCKYCVITQVDHCAKVWKERFVVGLSRAMTVLNPPLDLSDDSALASFYNFPLELLEGDIVGFNVISDPFWPKYLKELEWFLSEVLPLAKAAVVITKLPISRSRMKHLATIPHLQLSVSITGLDSIEKTSTRSRLRTLALAREYGVDAFPSIHPYIAGMTDLSFLAELYSLGYEFVGVRGLLYDSSMSHWMPEASNELYAGTGNCDLLPEDGWREKILNAGLQLKSFHDWSLENTRSSPRLSLIEAESRVSRLVSCATITSSGNEKEIIQAAINRRL